jgi:hypothetical protein
METFYSMDYEGQQKTCKGEELLAPCPTPKLEDQPLPTVRNCLFNVFAATLRNWRPFLHPQPEDAPCRGDRDPHNTGMLVIKIKKQTNNFVHITKFKHAECCVILCFGINFAETCQREYELKINVK